MMTRLIVNPLTLMLLIIFSGVSRVAHSIEEPEYEVVKSFDDVEIRHYQPVIQATTTMDDTSGSSSGFRTLAGFIFGGNDQEQKISMTAPVQETLGVDSPQMSFTMPAEYAMEDLPKPDNERVILRPVAAKTVAVVQFSGWATSSKVARYEQELREALQRNSIKIAGGASLNQYNPPWTLPFLRRNEITIEIVHSS